MKDAQRMHGMQVKDVGARVWYFILGVNACYLGILAWAHRAEYLRKAEVAERIRTDLENKGAKIYQEPTYSGQFMPKAAPRTPGFRPR